MSGSQSEKNSSVFEEANPFPESLASAKEIDGVQRTEVLTETENVPSGETEEVSLASVQNHESSDILDETPMINTQVPETQPVDDPFESSEAFDLEAMAKEIDQLSFDDEKITDQHENDKDFPEETAPVEQAADNTDFWNVLEDSQMTSFTDVLEQSGDLSIDLLLPVEELDPVEDTEEPLQDEIKTKSNPLHDNDDIKIVSLTGYGIEPAEMMNLLQQVEPGSRKPFRFPSHVISLDNTDTAESVLLSDEQKHDAEISEDVAETAADVAFSDNAINMEIPEIIEPVKEDVQIATEPNIMFLSQEELVEDKIADTQPEKESESVEESLSVPEEISSEEPAPIVPEPEAEEDSYEKFSLTPVDLFEAEKIAREEIMLLSEDDLIEELGEYEVFPDTDEKNSKTESARSVNVESGKSKEGITYYSASESQMKSDHCKSIESDVLSNSTLIIEEDVEEIRKKLVLIEEEDVVLDITDKVVILDDADDVNRMAAGISEEKREDMKKLLHYLDGLFDKLPEDVVRNFADSEYFDIYVKIMNEFGE